MTPRPGERYVALGSSFGSGPGLPPRATGSPLLAGRSAVNYAHLVARAFQLDLCDVTFSGATTPDLLGAGRHHQPAQIEAVTAQTRLVTITGGGNDIDYIPALINASLPGPLPHLPRVRRRIEKAIDPTTMDARINLLQEHLTDLVQQVRQRAPDAPILIVDYLTILPADLSLIGAKPDAATARWALDAASRMSETFARVADLNGCEMIPAGRQSKQHHAWSDAPWTRRFGISRGRGAPYHPNRAGMQAVADLITGTLGSGARPCTTSAPSATAVTTAAILETKRSRAHESPPTH